MIKRFLLRQITRSSSIRASRRQKLTRQTKGHNQIDDNHMNRIPSNKTTSAQTVQTRSPSAVSIKLEGEERLDHVAFQRTILQEKENRMNNKAALAICHIATIKNSASEPIQQPQHTSPDNHFPSSSSQLNDAAQEDLSSIHKPALAQPGRQTLAGLHPNRSPNQLLIGEAFPVLIKQSPIACNSRIRNIMIRSKAEGLDTQTTATTRGCTQSMGPLTMSSHTNVFNLLQSTSHFRKTFSTEESHFSKEKRNEVNAIVTSSKFLRLKTLRPRSYYIAVEESILIEPHNIGLHSHWDRDHSTIDKKDTMVGKGNHVFLDQSIEEARRVSSV